MEWNGDEVRRSNWVPLSVVDLTMKKCCCWTKTTETPQSLNPNWMYYMQSWDIRWAIKTMRTIWQNLFDSVIAPSGSEIHQLRRILKSWELGQTRFIYGTGMDIGIGIELVYAICDINGNRELSKDRSGEKTSNESPWME